MEAKDQVLQAMREIGAPVNAGKIAEVTGLDRSGRQGLRCPEEGRRHRVARPL